MLYTRSGKLSVVCVCFDIILYDNVDDVDDDDGWCGAVVGNMKMGLYIEEDKVTYIITAMLYIHIYIAHASMCV